MWVSLSPLCVATTAEKFGRAKVNFFVAKYDSQDMLSFQKACLNFIQRWAYSVATFYKLKIDKNGNITIDGDGHIGELNCYNLARH